MKIKEAKKITHSLSDPGKMPGYAYSIPAHECQTGTKLRGVPARFVLNVTRTSAGGIDSKMLKTRNIKDWRRSSTHNGRELWRFKSIQKK